MEASYKVIAIDGHVCQNLYIACEAIEAGKEAVNSGTKTFCRNLK